MNNKFHDKVRLSQSNIILKLNPKFEQLPLPITWFDDPFLPFGKQVIDATQDLVAGYLFDFASYLAMGGAGVIALERTIAYVPKSKVRILHGAFTGKGFSPMADTTGFDLSAITVTTLDDVNYYTNHVPYMAFIATTQNLSVPDTGGIYRTDLNTLQYDHTQLIVTTDAILYSSKQDDFADKIREGIQALS